jgi:hypothetical protein
MKNILLLLALGTCFAKVNAQPTVSTAYCGHPSFQVYQDALFQVDTKGNFSQGKVVGQAPFSVYGYKEPVLVEGGSIVVLTNYMACVCPPKNMPDVDAGYIYECTIATPYSFFAVAHKKEINFPAHTVLYFGLNTDKYGKKSVVAFAQLPAVGIDVDGKHYIGSITFEEDGSILRTN